MGEVIFLQASVCSQGGRCLGIEGVCGKGGCVWYRGVCLAVGCLPRGCLADPPPPPTGKQTPSAATAAVSTHPTGMHSCLFFCS